MGHRSRVRGPVRLAALEGHGTRPMILDLIVDDPDTYRRYGRRLIRAGAARCLDCRAVDQRDARLTRMHAAYRRRNR